MTSIPFLSSNSLRKDADELLRLAMLTESENVKRILTSEATKLVQVAESQERAGAGAQSVPRATVKPLSSVTKITNYGWDQSEKFVKIYVTFNGVQNFAANCVTSHFEDRSFELQILDDSSKKVHALSIKNLLSPIVPSESYNKVKTDMVIVFLKKASSNHWNYVTEAEKKAKDVKTPKVDKDEDPSSSLMSLMKQMYEDGDDEMKRTIAKAWTEARDKKTPEEML